MRPYIVVSLWTLIQLDAANLIAASSYLAGCACEWKALIQVMNAGHAPPHALPLEKKGHFLVSVQRIRDAADELDMTAAKAAAARAFDECMKLFGQDRRYTARELQMLIPHAERVVHPFNDEVRARLIFTVDAKHARFFSDEPTFGERVDDAFPSATAEIVDAGKCRALGRWTACVMHLMRALEPALNALASHVEVAPDQNWNTALNQIDAKLKGVSKASNGAEAEQWASEVSAHFRMIKNAWRNHAAHGRARYNEDEAVAIFDNVRFSMKTLARRLGE